MTIRTPGNYYEFQVYNTNPEQNSTDISKEKTNFLDQIIIDLEGGVITKISGLVNRMRFSDANFFSNPIDYSHNLTRDQSYKLAKAIREIQNHLDYISADDAKKIILHYFNQEATPNNICPNGSLNQMLSDLRFN